MMTKKRAATIRRDAVADVVDDLHARADRHHNGPGAAIRRKVLRQAAYDLDVTIGRHAQRRADRARTR